MKFILFAVASLLLWSCSKPNEVITEWRGEGHKPQLATVGFNDIQEIKIGNTTLKLGTQSFAGAQIVSSYLKEISGDSDLKLAASSAWSGLESSLKKEVLRLQQKDMQVIPALQQQAGRFKDYKYFQSPKVELIKIEQTLRPVFSVLYLNKASELFHVRVSEDFKIISETQEGSHFSNEGLALVFPDGPKKSQLQEVLLKNLNPDASLSNSNVKVTSESTQTVVNENGQFNYSPPDEKFDQVQVFFYLNRALDWFTQELGVKTKPIINAVVHIGYPEKTNAAFYYNGQMRFGAGDEVAYSKIPLDPSIVMHEAAHSLIDIIAHLPFQAEGGSINEGFADYFTAVQLKNPQMAEVSFKKGPFKRTIKIATKLSEKNGGLYHDSAIVSGALWSLYEKVGQKQANKIALETLMLLTPASDLAQFATLLNQRINANLVGSDLDLAKAEMTLREL